MSSLITRLLAPFADATMQTIHDIVNGTFIALMAIASIAAIILVLLQPANSDGIDALGGGSSETFYGKNKGRSIESKLKMWTFICLGVLAVIAVIFFILQIPAIWE